MISDKLILPMAKVEVKVKVNVTFSDSVDFNKGFTYAKTSDTANISTHLTYASNKQHVFDKWFCLLYEFDKTFTCIKTCV